MKNIENKNRLGDEKRVLSVPVKRSFKETLKEVEDRIEWFCLRPDRRPQGRELAMIIAEVELLPPDAMVRIDGNDISAALVAEVYSELRNDHIVFVLDNLAALNYRFRSAKTYIRTALYNAALTLENSYDNMVNSEI